MTSPPSFWQILILGSIAGFTIYLGLPFALVRSKTLRTFASALSVGVLIFILIEILEKSFDMTKDKILHALSQKGEWGAALPYLLLFLLGVAGAYLGLVLFESKWLETEDDALKQPTTLALIIATGIGLHNFSEGLAIGQELGTGAFTFGLILVIGFALHNTTEGFGIAAPLTGEKPGLGFLFLLGLIGGGPTLLGTIVGDSFTFPLLEIFFLALASGAILYIIAELTHLGRLKGSHMTLAAGILTGLFLSFASEIVIDGGHALAAAAVPASQEITIMAMDNSLMPSEVLLKANQPARLTIQNNGKHEHQIEMRDFGIQKEVEPGESASFVITPKKIGENLLLMDPDGANSKIKSILLVSP